MPNLITRVQVDGDWYEAGVDPGAIIGGQIQNPQVWDNGLEYGGYPAYSPDSGTAITVESDPIASAALLTVEARVAALEADPTTATALAAEVTARTAGDTAEATARAAAITAETGARQAADTALETRISALEAVDHSATQNSDAVAVTHTAANYTETGAGNVTAHLSGIDSRLGELAGMDQVVVAADIAARDALSLGSVVTKVHVADASADPTVDAGHATYLWDGVTFTKTAEGESLDLSFSAFSGADGTNPGTSGLVPAPAAADNTKALLGDGTFGDTAATVAAQADATQALTNAATAQTAADAAQTDATQALADAAAAQTTATQGVNDAATAQTTADANTASIGALSTSTGAELLNHANRLTELEKTPSAHTIAPADWGDNGDGTWSAAIGQSDHKVIAGRRPTGVAVWDDATDELIEVSVTAAAGGNVVITANADPTGATYSVEIMGATS